MLYLSVSKKAIGHGIILAECPQPIDFIEKMSGAGNGI